MRIFVANGKYNFVDRHNVLVGYDSITACCESVGYIVSEAQDLDDDPFIECYCPADVEPYRFDPHWFRETKPGWVDVGGVVSFRLVADGLPNLYLKLYNAQNGYYSHGFTVDIGGHKIREGVI